VTQLYRACERPAIREVASRRTTVVFRGTARKSSTRLPFKEHVHAAPRLDLGYLRVMLGRMRVSLDGARENFDGLTEILDGPREHLGRSREILGGLRKHCTVSPIPFRCFRARSRFRGGGPGSPRSPRDRERCSLGWAEGFLPPGRGEGWSRGEARRGAPRTATTLSANPPQIFDTLRRCHVTDPRGMLQVPRAGIQTPSCGRAWQPVLWTGSRVSVEMPRKYGYMPRVGRGMPLN